MKIILELDPNYHRAHFVLSRLYRKAPKVISIGDPKKSLKHIDIALSMDPTESMYLLEKARVLDVRSAIEFSKGTIPNAVNVNKDNASCISALKGDLDNPVIFVCNQGTDSSKIASSLKKDLKEVYVINGGINAWKSEGFPIVN